MQLFRRIQNTINSSQIYLELKVRLGKDPHQTICSKIHTDMCIEGFPRSGNSYATSMFLLANPDCKAAHHTHNLGNVRKSVNLNVPTLVLIRKPLDAITSLYIYRQLGSAEFVKPLIEDYLFFYRGIKTINSDQIIVKDFSEVISDFNSVIDHVNTKFKKEFNKLENTATAEGMVRKDYGEKFKREDLPETQFPFPTENKRQRKAEIRPFVEKEKLYLQAKELYTMLTTP